MNWDYLAGFIDGEGGFYIRRILNKAGVYYYYNAHLCITNLNKEVIDDIAEFLVSNNVEFCYTSKPCDYDKDRLRYDILITGSKMQKVLDNIADKVIAKREHVRAMLRYMSTIVKAGNSFQYVSDSDRELREYLYGFVSWLNGSCE